MKILMITPEAAPFVKVGGLADVLGALPKALAKLGHDVRVVLPLHGGIKPEPHWIPYEHPLSVNVSPHVMHCRVWEVPMAGGYTVYFLEHHDFFGRKEIYSGPWGDHADNAHRFTFLTRAALNLTYYLGWMPDVVNCHDWTTGFAPVYLNTLDHHAPLGRAASVMTVHNLQHQGWFGPSAVDWGRLPAATFRPDCLESHGSVNMLKGGLFNATKITTVSPTYAKEIQTPAYGCGLDALLKFRASDLVGIINGIDGDEWNPATDKLLQENFSADHIEGKAVCKADLQQRAGLTVDPSAMLMGVVSRLFDQKGLDLLAEIVPQLVSKMNVQLVLLGNGDPELERVFRFHSLRNPDRVSAHVGYNHALAHQIYAGSDVFVMPSRFEPCGLSQQYAMAYGSVPIVRATGGLVDTVENYDERKGAGTGFVFKDATKDALYNTIGWACSTFHDRPAHFRKLQQAGMRRDASWDRSAREYVKVYRWAMDARAQAF